MKLVTYFLMALTLTCGATSTEQNDENHTHLACKDCE